MPARALVAAICLSALLPVSTAEARMGTHFARTGLVLNDGVRLRDKPSSHARSLAALVQQQQVKVLSQGKKWDRVLIWDSVQGWLPRDQITFRHPWKTTSSYRAPEVHYALRAHAPQAITVRGNVLARTALAAEPGRRRSGWLGAGASVSISGWQQDSSGNIWYRVAGKWAPGQDIQFVRSNSAKHAGALARTVSGKGMWLTLGTVAGTTSSTIVSAALRDGVTHLYVEAAISPLGFHGRNTVGDLIDKAHAHRVAVIAWVYPYLYDIGADVALTREVATFSTPPGQHFDGIAADLERNVVVSKVRAYSQLVRAYLGPRYLLIGVTFPPQSLPDYPFGEVAHNYDVIAPMDYWHQSKTPYAPDYGVPYGYAYAYKYAADSIARIRQASGNVPIAPIGQAFDNFGRLEMGPFAPSHAEAEGFLAGCRDDRAIGVSFFQWMTATNQEWVAIRDFRFK